MPAMWRSEPVADKSKVNLTECAIVRGPLTGSSVQESLEIGRLNSLLGLLGQSVRISK
jgi:hypothetical protein